MIHDTHSSKSDTRDGNVRGLLLVAVMLVGAGLGVMVWDDRQGGDRINQQVANRHFR
jgi:hypothetical protein